MNQIKDGLKNKLNIFFGLPVQIIYTICTDNYEMNIYTYESCTNYYILHLSTHRSQTKHAIRIFFPPTIKSVSSFLKNNNLQFRFWSTLIATFQELEFDVLHLRNVKHNINIFHFPSKVLTSLACWLLFTKYVQVS